VAKIVFHRVM